MKSIIERIDDVIGKELNEWEMQKYDDKKYKKEEQEAGKALDNLLTKVEEELDKHLDKAGDAIAPGMLYAFKKDMMQIIENISYSLRKRR